MRYFTGTYSLNGDAIEQPIAYSTKALFERGLVTSAQLSLIEAQSATELTFHFRVRFASLTQGAQLHAVNHDAEVSVHIAIDSRCDQLSHAIDWTIDEAFLASQPAFAAVFEPLNAKLTCLKGEAIVNDTCTPLTCDSPRACPNNACRSAPPNVDGVAFKCGCPTGYELNGHTLRCIAVTCEAPTACQPTAKCVMKTRELLLGSSCLPTTTSHEQWVRGSKPCPRFDCVSLP